MKADNSSSTTFAFPPLLPDNWTGAGQPGAGVGWKGDVVQGSLLVAIAILGAALNLFLMLAILPNPRMRSVRQVLLVHLAVVGLVTSLVLTLPAGILQLVTSMQASPQNLDPPLTTYFPAAASTSPSLQQQQQQQQQSLAVPPPTDVAPPTPYPVSPANHRVRPAAGERDNRVKKDGVGVTGGGLDEDEDGGGAYDPEEGAESRFWDHDGPMMSAAHAGPVCTLVGTSGVLLTAASVWTVAALAWDKHRAIANPLHHPLVAHKSTMAAWLAVLWTLSAALATPPVFGGGDLRFVPALARCGMHAGSSRGRWHALLVVAVGIVAPLSVMLYCYTHIFRIARAQSSRIAATMLRMVTLIQAPIAPPPARSAGMVRLRGTRAMATIVQLVGSCVASYVPWAVLLCHQAVTDETPGGLPAATAAILLHAAPLTAATVYGLRNRNLRSSFARFVSRKIQHCCRPHRRRPSVKSLTRNSSSAVTRKQAAQNGLSPTATGMLRRTFSLQHNKTTAAAAAAAAVGGGGGRPGARKDVEGGAKGTGGAGGRGGVGAYPQASDAFLPRPHSYNVLSTNFSFRGERDRDMAENSELHDVLEINSEFPAIELDMYSEFPGMLERETVT